MSDLRWLLDNVPEDSIEEHALEIEAAIKENAELKRALHELAQFDYRLGIDAMRKFAFDALLTEKVT